MKKYLITLLVLLSKFLTAQKSEICTCNLLKKSEDSVNTIHSKYKFRPVSKATARKPPFSFVSITYLQKSANSQNIVDSVEMKINNIVNKTIPDTLHDTYKIRDSIERLEYSKKYGDIPKPVIIKTGKLNGMLAILYRTRSYFQAKYYIRISKDNGETWKNYFTGLESNKNYIFKSNSQYPLWKDENNIQIEADIVRMIEEPGFPSRPEPEYEIVNNNALITLNLIEILKDSDHDGVNDLEEQLIYFTNPLSKDTDSDGISDFEDENPRYKNNDYDFTKLIEAIRFGDYPITENSDLTTDEFMVNVASVRKDIQNQMQSRESFSKPHINSFLDSLDLRVIATDDENIRRMKTYGEKTIFLTSNEYKKYSKYHYTISDHPYYSKIFKCDDKKDTYILMFDGLVSGETYIITKTPKGWLIKIVNRWMT